eukprot:761971-Hanusia_phi.AAC.3
MHARPTTRRAGGDVDIDMREGACTCSCDLIARMTTSSQAPGPRGSSGWQRAGGEMRSGAMARRISADDGAQTKIEDDKQASAREHVLVPSLALVVTSDRALRLRRAHRRMHKSHQQNPREVRGGTLSTVAALKVELT